MLQAGVWECRILGEKRYSTESDGAPRLDFCYCARIAVAFFEKDGIEREKPGCVTRKRPAKGNRRTVGLSRCWISALLNCRAANLQADSRIAFRLLQIKSPMTAGHRALVLRGSEGGAFPSRHRGFRSAKELLCWGIPLAPLSALSAILLAPLGAALLEDSPALPGSRIAGIPSRTSRKRVLHQRLRRKRSCYLARRPSSSM